MHKTILKNNPEDDYLIPHQWHFDVVGGNWVAGLLLSYMEKWHLSMLNTAMRKKNRQEIEIPDRELEFYRTMGQIEDGILNLATSKPILAGIRLLEKLGFLTRTVRPNSMLAYDRKTYYLLNTAAIQRAYDKLHKTCGKTTQQIPEENSPSPGKSTEGDRENATDPREISPGVGEINPNYTNVINVIQNGLDNGERRSGVEQSSPAADSPLPSGEPVETKSEPDESGETPDTESGLPDVPEGSDAMTDHDDDGINESDETDDLPGGDKSSVDSRFPSPYGRYGIKNDRGFVDWPAMIRTYDPDYSEKLQKLFPQSRWESAPQIAKSYYIQRREKRIEDWQIDAVLMFWQDAVFRVGDIAGNGQEMAVAPGDFKTLFSGAHFADTLRVCLEAGKREANILETMLKDLKSPATLHNMFVKGPFLTDGKPWENDHVLFFARCQQHSSPIALVTLYYRWAQGVLKPGDAEALREVVRDNAQDDPSLRQVLELLKFDLARCKEVFGYTIEELDAFGQERIQEIQAKLDTINLALCRETQLPRDANKS